jgi:hypothetical protein
LITGADEHYQILLAMIGWRHKNSFSTWVALAFSIQKVAKHLGGFFKTLHRLAVRDGDLRVVLDVTKVVDAELARVGDRTPDLPHHEHTP